MLQDSLISASVADGPGGGGNISIDPQFVILQNSQILAQAAQGQGGAITIIANLFPVGCEQSGQCGFRLRRERHHHDSIAERAGQRPDSAAGQNAADRDIAAQSTVRGPGRRAVQQLHRGGTGQPAHRTGQLARQPAVRRRRRDGGRSVWSVWSVGLGVSGVVRGGLAAHQIDQTNQINQTNPVLLSLRQIAPAGFLTQAFAVDEPQAVNHKPSHLRVKRLSGSSGLSGWFRLSRVFGYMRLTRSTRQGTVADTVFLPLISTFPHLRKSMQMQYGQHVDTLFPRMEVHAIGKVTEQRTVHLSSPRAGTVGDCLRYEGTPGQAH